MAKKNPPRHAPPKDTGFDAIMGTHSVLAALKNSRRTCVTLFYTGDFPLESIYPQAQLATDHPRLQITYLDKNDFARKVPEDSTHQRILLNARPLPGIHLDHLLKELPEKALILLLDQITDPHNLGAIMRSAAVFGACAVVVTERNSPSGDSLTLAKTASGAMEEVPLCPVTNLNHTMQDLKNAGFWLVGLAEEGGDNLRTLPLSNRIGLVLGSEGSGLRRLTKESCDFLVRIQTAPTFSTLNASNAAGIALYEVFCRRQS